MTWEIERRDLIKGALGFAAALAIPSIGLIQHSVGNIYILLWLSFQMPLLVYIYCHDWDFIHNVSDLKIIVLGVSILVFFIVFIAIAYPLANKNIIPGRNERDEIMLGAINELLNGRYPFYFTGGKYSPVSSMPGWLLFNVPFAFFKIYWMQNIFWLTIFYLILSKYLLNKRSALFFIIIILFLCPVVIHELISGSELLSNVLLITSIGILILRYEYLDNWMKFSLAIIAGFAFSSRAHFLFLLPVFFSFVLQKTGIKDSLRFFGLLTLTAIAVTLPFYIYDPHGFSPLHTSMYINPLKYLSFYDKTPSSTYLNFKIIFDNTDKIIIIIMTITSIYFAIKQNPKNEPWYFLYACALILAVPVLLGILSLSIVLNYFEVGPFANHGLCFMFFGGLSAWSYRENFFS